MTILLLDSGLVLISKCPGLSLRLVGFIFLLWFTLGANVEIGYFFLVVIWFLPKVELMS